MVRELTAAVTRGDVKPAERIGSESDLIQRFGVSRAVVREALRLLERDGIVSVKPGPSGGIFGGYPGVQSLVRSIDVYGMFHDVTPDHLIEAHTELEVLTAGLAAVRADADDLAGLQRLNDEWVRLAGAADKAAAARLNVDFHVALTRAAHNPVFVAFIDALEGLLYTAALTARAVDAGPDVVYSHEPIVDALRRRDPVGAAACMREHLERFRPDGAAAPSGEPASGSSGPAPAPAPRETTQEGGP
jgi:GntR family transcriptional regulator, transcriptional repressor for pyruvate dehydrogenase complex